MKVNEPGHAASSVSLDARDQAILARLRESGGALSGQAMAEALGISRVALWKRIERLKGLAYRIEGSHAGYCLVADDAITPEEIGGGPVRSLPVVGSTMDEAWAWAQDGAPSGALVIAGRQEAGRGQHGRSWLSPEGGLYLTLVLRPDLPLSHSGSLLLEGAAWVAGWLAGQGAGELELRWPNDLYCRGRKIGGVLAEAAGSPDSPRFFTLGLGVNFHALDQGPPGGRPAIGLDETGAAVRRRELAAAFRDHMAAWSAAPELRPAWWAERAAGLGRCLELEERPGLGRSGRGTIRARGFDRRGGLLTGDPERPVILPGEVARVEYPA
jgi:BirA family biotin operon repressor/biotin-[acetyl-CoA-carboxylase] ligase